MANTIGSPPLKWHGGKHYLAKRITGLMPPHVHYVEPFAGGLAVLLAKDPEGVSEVANDLDGDLTNFWRVLQHPSLFPQFQRACEATPFSEAEFRRAEEGLGVYTCEVGRAWAFFVHCRMSLAGRRESFAPLSKTRVRRGMNEQASAWLSAVDGLAEVHARMRRVVIRCSDALDVIRQEDTPGTLFYLDPPYLHKTRVATDAYRHELSDEGHARLLALLPTLKARVMLSGYDSPLYADRLAGWTRHAFDLPNHAAGGGAKRRMTEVVWCNFTI